MSGVFVGGFCLVEKFQIGVIMNCVSMKSYVKMLPKAMHCWGKYCPVKSKDVVGGKGSCVMCNV